ncbi:MAG: hypothetical protein ACR2JY_20365 [Chloroflexota bacterium]
MSKLASHQVVLRDLSQLGDYLAHEVEADADGSVTTPAAPATSETSVGIVAVVETNAPADAAVPHLLELLAQAGADLARLVQQDQEARQAAGSLLTRYDDLQAERGEAEAVRDRAGRLRLDAETLAAGALEEAARAAAATVQALAARAEAAATQLAEERRAELEALTAEPFLARLLAERRCAQERQNAAAAEAEQARRLAEDLAAVRAALAAGNLQEAETMLGMVAKLCPNSADIASIQSIIRQRVASVKVNAAEEALREARRSYRRVPAEAIARLERVDLQDLPEQLAHQLKGVWAAACARLCAERQVTGLFRYLPQPGFGVVVAREPAGEYRIVSALGSPQLAAGAAVDEAFARRAQPLRSAGR